MLESDQLSKGLIPEAKTYTANDITLDKGPSFKVKGVGFGGKDKTNLKINTGEGSIKAINDDTGFLAKRAIKRYTMTHPNMPGAEGVLGNDNKLPSVLGQKTKWAPWSTLKQDAQAVQQVDPVTETVEDAVSSVTPVASKTASKVDVDTEAAKTEQAKRQEPESN